MTISRRKFIESGLGLMGMYMSAPHMLTLGAQAAEFNPRLAGKQKILVVVQMGGGNDGLNCVVPYSNGTYYQQRPVLGIKPDKVLPLNNDIAFNPNMEALHGLFKSGNVALVQGVGYPNPNRSHFRSIEIWQTAQPEKIIETGWLGRYLDCAESSPAGKGNLFAAVNVEPTLPKTLSASKVLVPSVSNVFDFKFRTDTQYESDRKTQLKTFESIYSSFDLDRSHADLLRKVGMDANQASDYLQKIVRSYQGSVKYPDGPFGNGMKFIAQMISGGVNSSVYTVNLDGFDTHTNQLGSQNRLLKQFSEGVSAFYKDLTAHGLQDDVVIFAFSEFGRRVAENNGRGTDHGTAGPVYVIGSNVKGGVYGDHPSLTELDAGDLKYKIDFRCVYATLLDKWLGADSREILGQHFDYIPFV
jgi:uncharacterized protein (DUF1501 family)